MASNFSSGGWLHYDAGSEYTMSDAGEYIPLKASTTYYTTSFGDTSQPGKYKFNYSTNKYELVQEKQTPLAQEKALMDEAGWPSPEFVTKVLMSINLNYPELTAAERQVKSIQEVAAQLLVPLKEELAKLKAENEKLKAQDKQ